MAPKANAEDEGRRQIHEWHGWDRLNGSHGDAEGAEVFSHRLKRIREETVSASEQESGRILIFGRGHPGKKYPLKSSPIRG
jgi:hypothetical protein